MPAPGDADPVDATVGSNTGAATYSIPIDVPPGPGGLAPRLALTYSSHAGDGFAGVGWRLQLGEIRCTTKQRGVPDFSACQPANPSSPVRYELDGQLLTAAPTAGRYHTFIESFREIKYISATAGWVANAPDGTILHYGSTVDSRIAAGGATARWLLSEIEDPFENKILLSYSSEPDTDPSGGLGADPGTAYPHDISYASGDRTINFVYEPRTDPLHDFAGGIERTITRRLKEIQVASDGDLVHKRIFGYSGLEGASYTIGGSRLAWTQLVGSDGTSTLPRQEFRYTDHGLTGSQWGPDNPTWHLGNHPIFGEAPNPPGFAELEYQLGDVDGDGLLDRVGYGGVELGTGTGWDAPDPAWSEALTNTCCPSVRLRATVAIPDDEPISLGVVEGSAEVKVVDPSDGTIAEVIWGPNSLFAGFLSTSGTWWDLTYVAEPNSIATAELFVFGGMPPEGELPEYAIGGSYRVVDLNADGLADLVYSFYLSGITESISATGAPLEEPERIEGKQVLVGCRNTGSGWVCDEDAQDLVSGLPPFSALMVESPYEIAKEKSWSNSCANNDGLLGFGHYYQFSIDWLDWMDFCMNVLRFGPRFVDLNGDGYLDLIVSERGTPPAPPPGTPGYAASNLIAWNPPSRAWIQDPQHAPGTPRWVRAPAFDPPFFHQRLIHLNFECHDAAPIELCPASRQYDAGVRFADMNRDGLTDIVWSETGDDTQVTGGPYEVTEHRSGVLINRGGGPEGPATPAGSAWCSSHTECPWAAAYVPPASFVGVVDAGSLGLTFSTGDLADLNGDGWIDIVHYDPSLIISGGQIWGGTVTAWLHSRDTPSGSSPVWIPAAGGPFDPPDVPGLWSVSFPDLNGDGAADLVMPLWQDFEDDEKVFISQQDHIPDLLREIDNGRGGTLRFDYTRASRQHQASLDASAQDDAAHHVELNPGPGGLWSLPVVSAVTVEGPNRVPATTTYAYAHPRFCPGHRAGFGFRVVQRTRPDLSTVDEFFYQKHGRAGRTSKLLVKQSGSVAFRREEVWELPTGLIPGSLADPEVRVGRLAKICSAQQYGGTPGTDIHDDCTAAEFGTGLGAFRSRTFSYDDVYGFNFVNQIDDARPTGTLHTVREPVSPSTSLWLRGFVAEERQEDAGGIVLSRTTFEYTGDGRVASRNDDVQHRGDAPSSVATSFLYDGYGNLIQRTDPPTPAKPSGRVTEFCYDGDGGWCAEVAEPHTHSVLVGMKDPLGNITSRLPDPLTGVIVETVSGFTDEPGIRRELDPFGRLKREYAKPFGANEFLRSEIRYEQGADPPYTQRTDFVSRTAGGPSVQTVTVEDGFGGVWKTVEERPGGFMGRAVWHDPGNARVRETYPIDCGSSPTCAGVTGETELATVTVRDLLGRPVEIATADGTSLVTYAALARPPPISGPQASLDLVRFVNAKGDVTQRLLDRDRVVWVDECSSDPEDPDCETADRTYYRYEASGELGTIYDPVFVANAGQTGFDETAHQLVYHYDNVGRAWKIEDPDGGTSTNAYDAVGNVQATTNARGQIATFQYDALDRLEWLDQQSPGPQRDYDPVYVPGQRQPDRERILAQNGTLWHRLTYQYDDMGRVQRTTYKFPDKTMLLDFAYDELGRLTAVTYPDTETVVRYEYAGAYLEQVCEVTSPSTPCEDEDAISYVDSIEYDALGRRKGVHTPAGDRSYTYDSSTQRLTLDQFESRSVDAYTRELTYTAYDALGNLLQVEGESQTNAVDFSATYAYDHRNRLATWQTPGMPAPKHFNYDALGNLTGHAVGSSAAQNQEFGYEAGPHAVTARTDLDLLFTYDDDGNLASETDTSSGVARYFTFDVFNRLSCVGPSAGSCLTLFVDYDSGGARIHENYLDSSGGWVARRYAGEYFTLDGTRGDFHIFAFGEEIAYKRMFPVTLRTASAWVLPGIELPPPLALAILAALGLASLGFVAVRRDWAPGLREDPVLAAFSLCLVVVLVVPPLPARAGGGGGNVLYRRWILADPLGSATVILEANPVEPSETQEGRAEREVVYKPFGDIHEDAGSQGMDTGIFAGHPLEPTTGLHYMRARWQNPKTGSFLSVDPLVGAVADPQSYNGYSYARSNPLSHLDPTGMDCSSAAAASCSMYVSETGHNYTVTITYLDSTLSEALAAGWAAIGSSASSGLTSIGLSGFSGLGGPGLGLGPGPIGPSFALPGGGGPGLTAAPSSQSGGGGESPWIAAGAAVGVLAADDVTGVGAVNDLLIPVVLAGAATYDLTQRTFITYTLTNPVGQAYVGRASGFGTPQSILNRRLSTHHATALGFGAPKLDRAVQGAQGYPAIRGREQQLIDSFGGVGSPNVGNAIRGVSRFNPLGRVYHGASDAYFGPLAPYTGY